MNRYQTGFANKYWAPALKPRLVRWLRGVRARRRERVLALPEVEVRGAEIVKQALTANQRVLITPNHASHADPDVIHYAADRFDSPLYIMAAWQVFSSKSRIAQRLLQWHGVFSVDREANDLNAFREAINVLRTKDEPLVLFPEGEIYHCNDRVTPFREGAAAIAISAAKKNPNPVVVIPCAIKYRYIESPIEDLKKIMTDLEAKLFFKTYPNRELPERIYRFATTLLSVLENEFTGTSRPGGIPQRVKELSSIIMQDIEDRLEIKTKEDSSNTDTLPKRVKQARQAIYKLLEEPSLISSREKELYAELNELFLVVQLFSYPGDYVAETPTVERLAETIDKFEEDYLGRESAGIRGKRKATVTFGQPIPVSAEKGKRPDSNALTDEIENAVQEMLDDLNREPHQQNEASGYSSFAIPSSS